MPRAGERTDLIYIINQRLEKLERDLNKMRNEYHEETQSRSERCTVCENYYTPSDIASRTSGRICFYCYNPVRCSCGDKSQDGGMI